MSEALRPDPADLRIEQVGYGHPDAMLLINEVQAEYVLRYGGPDVTPLDPLMFEPPTGSFFVGYLPIEGASRPIASGAWRTHDDVEVFGTRRTAEIKRMYVAPRGPAPRAGPADAGPPGGDRGRRPAPRR